MTTLDVTEARANLHKLIDDTLVNHEPVVCGVSHHGTK